MRGFTSHNNVTKKVSKQVERKIRILSSIRDHRKKVGKQGRSPTPADILVNLIQSWSWGIDWIRH